MSAQPDHVSFLLDPADNERLSSLCGNLDEHLRQIERRLGVEISNRGHLFRLVGDPLPLQAAESVIRELYASTADNALAPSDVHLALQASGMVDRVEAEEAADDEQAVIQTKRGRIKPRGPGQNKYVQSVRSHDINFGIGPAGTGKTYLAVACAVEALERDEVRRLVLTRPAVEAGEKLGFLPGDLAQKIDPYLRPLYDALYEMLGFERVAKLIERNVIEVAPLAYMRGRTLNESFIILDEAQNTTPTQMKMFLTRIGFGSTAVVTGDVSQTDLPRGQLSGLRHATEVLNGVKGMSFTFFRSRDVVRHPLVQRVVDAYEAHDEGGKAG